ncbi:MAG: phage tail tip lysozyme [Lachnospiraceae bacterium]|nr:phage tail tip lysozyme [Lachnospiraceae bacterium]
MREINRLISGYNHNAGDVSRIKYIVIHYTGALGDAKANCNYFAGGDRNASAHYFVGYDGAVWQSVEDANIAWHCGAKSYKHAECRNANSIGIEMCVRKKDTSSQNATDKDWYFEDATVEAAAELTRYLMDKYNVPASHVIRHYDVTGKICPNPYVYNTTGHTWDEFKQLVSGAASAGGSQTDKLYRVRKSWEDAKSQTGAYSSLDNAKKACTDGYTVYDWDGRAVYSKAAAGSMVQNTSTEKAIWDYLTGRGLNAYAVAGLMGNLYAESGLNSCNLQNSYNKSLNMTDAEYTAAVDNGSYGNFVKDKAGYGLAQWTYYTRKQALLDYARSADASIGSLDMQLAFLWQELQGYKAVISALKAAATVRAASDAVLTGYEKPADQSEAVKAKRAAYGQEYYNKYAGSGTSGNAASAAAGKVEAASVPFKVKIDIADLRIRTGAGTGYAFTGKYTGIGVFTITEVKAGEGSAAGWGKLLSNAGWIALDYCTRL